MNPTHSRQRSVILLVAALGIAAAAVTGYALWPRSAWSEPDLAALRGLWIGSLKPLPPDPSNQYADDPRAAALGQELFFDTRFSANGQVACATCHLPNLMFQDGRAQAHGIGTTNRRAMTIVGTAYSPWLFWDGRKDSQWAQALGPLESPVEHGGNRTLYAHLIDQYYRAEYEAIFGPLPQVSPMPGSAGPVADPQAKAAWAAMSDADRQAVTRVYANMGKAIAAYERLIVPGPARFDDYVAAVIGGHPQQAAAILTPDEVAGLRLFIGQANCTQCHNGPLFTNNDFHNTGVPAVAALPADSGRARGAQQVQADEFNCLSVYSDAKQGDCSELVYMAAEGEALMRQFKPPSLRNVVGRGPYMDAGQFATLEQVLAHYNTAPAAPAGHSQIHPLNLNEIQIHQLIAFLNTLSGPINADPKWLRPPAAR